MDDGAVLITGASGLLGTWLRQTAPDGERVISLRHRAAVDESATVEADLREEEAVLAVVREVQPSLIIHAAYAKDHASIVTATDNVVAAASAVDAALLFVSTDAVFSGDGVSRPEDSAPDPGSDYGRWKAEAEAIASQIRGAAIVRTSLIVSVDPDDHVVAVIRSSASQGEQTAWYIDQTRQPALAVDLANAIWRIASLARADRAGPWHLPGPEILSRFEIAKRVAATLGFDQDLIATQSMPVGSDRGQHIVLADDRARRSIGWAPSPILR